ncbi:MAG: restriction endonuclease [Burkholderiaceae bacterium]|nr:restriction endonuclease [Burkholderiaceae bacterium]
MAKRKNNKRQDRELEKILQAGVMALFLGIAFLLAPSALSKSPNFKAVGAGLGTFAWPAFGAGLLLIGLYLALKQVGKKTANTPEIKQTTSQPKREPAVKPKEPAQTPLEQATAQAAPSTSAWSPAVFAAIEWRRFEAVCEALFAQAGFETRSQSHGADGGVDIWLHSANAQGPVSIVQCKHWQGKQVGVKELREFYGVMASHRLQRGTYATTASYSADAIKFAQDNGINAMDGAKLLALIASRTPEQQQALMAVAYAGDYARPTCANCGIKLIERIAGKTGKAFWGCSNYPRCKSTLPMLASLR